mgnify:CR=1 FL=1
MIEQLVQTWGYAAVFAGTFLEGETVLIAAVWKCSNHSGGDPRVPAVPSGLQVLARSAHPALRSR